RRPMVVDRQDAFSVKLDRVGSSFRYRVEAGVATSVEHEVFAVDPVEIAENTAVTLTPPDYAKATIETQTVKGVTDLALLQHGNARFELHFTQPAKGAFMVWSAEKAGVADAKAEPVSFRRDVLPLERSCPACATPTSRTGLAVKELPCCEEEANPQKEL